MAVQLQLRPKLGPQTADILQHLEAGFPLSPQEALRLFGCFRLAARVLELRAAGYPVITVRRNGHAVYFLEAA